VSSNNLLHFIISEFLKGADGKWSLLRKPLCQKTDKKFLVTWPEGYPGSVMGCMKTQRRGLISLSLIRIGSLVWIAELRYVWCIDILGFSMHRNWSRRPLSRADVWLCNWKPFKQDLLKRNKIWPIKCAHNTVLAFQQLFSFRLKSIFVPKNVGNSEYLSHLSVDEKFANRNLKKFENIGA
jgi:hypothetical protein